MKPKKNSTKSVKAKPTTRKRKAVAKAPSKEKKLSYIDGKTAEAVEDKERLRDLEKLLNPSSLHNPFKVTNAEDLDKIDAKLLERRVGKQMLMFNHRGERILEGVCEGRFPEPRKWK